MASEINQCVFCKLTTLTRGHHLIPRCKSGTIIVNTCPTCENFIHSTWSHNELRDVYNTVDSILNNEKFQKFLKWRLKQPSTVIFKSTTGKFRDKNKYH
jgi:hypothetical protein